MADFKTLTSDNKLDMSLDDLIAAQQQKTGGAVRGGHKGTGAAGQQQRGGGSGGNFNAGPAGSGGGGEGRGAAGAAAGGRQAQQNAGGGRRLAAQTRVHGSGPYSRPPGGYLPGGGAPAPNNVYRDAVELRSGRDYLLEATNAGGGGRHPGGGGVVVADAAAGGRGAFVPYVYTVKVKNLPVNLPEEELEEGLRRHFSCCGRVVRVVFRRGVPGEAYVGFQDASSCGKALAELQGSKLRGNPLAIEKGLPTLPGGTGYYPGGSQQQRMAGLPLHASGALARGVGGGVLYEAAAPEYISTRRQNISGGQQQPPVGTGRLSGGGVIVASSLSSSSSSSPPPPYNYLGPAAGAAHAHPLSSYNVMGHAGGGSNYIAAAGAGDLRHSAVYTTTSRGAGSIQQQRMMMPPSSQQQQQHILYPSSHQQQQQGYISSQSNTGGHSVPAAGRVSGLLGHYPSDYADSGATATAGANTMAAGTRGHIPVHGGGGAAARDIYAATSGLPYTNGDVIDVYGNTNNNSGTSSHSSSANVVGNKATATAAQAASRAAATVIVSNVPCDLTAEELQDAFAVVGTVLQTELLLNSSGYPTGRVAITYSNRQAAVEAVRRFDGGDLNAHTIRVFLE